MTPAETRSSAQAQDALRELVGLMPAGGQAKRLAPLPCSKEVFPVGFHEEGKKARPRAVCRHLLEGMQLAGVKKVYCVLRSGKWDIPAYLNNGDEVGMPLAYLLMGVPYGVPFTLDQVYPFVQDARVACGFPDILFRPRDAFVRLLERQADTGAAVVLGLFPTDRPHKADMVDLDAQGQIRSIVIKPAETTLRYAWILAVWTPVFTQFMHAYLRVAMKLDRDRLASGERELHLGDVLQAAIDEDLHIEAVPFPEGRYLDIGTPDDLARAVRGTW